MARLTGTHPDTVGRGARELEAGIEPDGRVRYAKTVEGHQHPDRDGQFRFISELVAEFQEAAAGDQRRHQEEGIGLDGEWNYALPPTPRPTRPTPPEKSQVGLILQP